MRYSRFVFPLWALLSGKVGVVDKDRKGGLVRP